MPWSPQGVYSVGLLKANARTSAALLKIAPCYKA